MPRRRVNPNETAEQRFKRVAEARTNSALERIRLLGNLADKRRYNYEPEDVAKMFGAINKQVRDVRSKFGSRARRKFRL
ncbi:MAG: hypothetical protein ABIH70_08475 [Chloroflexota bacterium]